MLIPSLTWHWKMNTHMLTGIQSSITGLDTGKVCWFLVLCFMWNSCYCWRNVDRFCCLTGMLCYEQVLFDGKCADALRQLLHWSSTSIDNFCCLSQITYSSVTGVCCYTILMWLLSFSPLSVLTFCKTQTNVTNVSLLSIYFMSREKRHHV